MSMSSPWMTTEEAAKYAGKSPECLCRYARLGKVQPGGDGRHWLWTEQMIDDMFLAMGKTMQESA